MASGANQVPLGRLNLRQTSGSSLLKPDYVRATEGANGDSRSPSTEQRASAGSEKFVDASSDRSRDRDYERDKDYDRDRKRDRSRERDERDYREKSDSRSSATRDEGSYPTKRKSRFSDTKEGSISKDGGRSKEGSKEPSLAKEDSPIPGKKQRRSRWADIGEQRAFIPGMPTIIPSQLTKEQERIYILQLQIEDISRKLRTGDLGIAADPDKRSPSPEPIYNHEGKRLNTRDMRTRRKLEDERHLLVQEMYKINIDYKPPPDYKAPLAKFTDKVLIPQDEHPEINFVGLLIGPRGNTLKALEKETGTKIIIRGKGSVKEGKIGRPNRDPMPGEDEPLHAYITGQTPEAVKGSVERIKRILLEGIEVPEHQNDLRKQQLRELALLHGTLRDEGGPRCSNCGSTQHRSFNCPDKPNITHTIICNRCGGTGHIGKDCRADLTREENQPSANMDEEYLSLMAELGQGPPVAKAKPAAAAPAPTPSSAPPPPPPAQNVSAPSTQSYNSAPPPSMYSGHGSNGAPPGMSYNAPGSAVSYPSWGAPPPPPMAPSYGSAGAFQPMWAPPPPPPPAQQYPAPGHYGAPPAAQNQYDYWNLPPPPPPPM